MLYHTVEDHSQDGERSGEGAAVELRDGRLLLLYSAFRGGGGADHAPGNVFRRVSADGGGSWGPSQMALPTPPGALNTGFISLLRLQDGRIGCVYLVKWTAHDHCIPYWTFSEDEGETWAESRAITPERSYFVVNNDRLVQLRDGTLLLPYAWHGDIGRDLDDNTPFRESLNARCGIFYSKDGGASWQRPDTARRFEKRWFTPPTPFRPDKVEEVSRKIVEARYDVFQEPGVVELEGGIVMMWVRSNAHLYWSLLRDGLDGPWEEFRVLEGFNICKGPQLIKRLPGSQRLVMLYNDRGDEGYGEPDFMTRTPLSIAFSDDEGQTWQRTQPLEGDLSRSYCYASLLFFGTRFLATYYESVPRRLADGSLERTPQGTVARRTLASLKTCVGDLSFFENATPTLSV